MSTSREWDQNSHRKSAGLLAHASSFGGPRCRALTPLLGSEPHTHAHPFNSDLHTAPSPGDDPLAGPVASSTALLAML